jgi:hypothetical protein
VTGTQADGGLSGVWVDDVVAAFVDAGGGDPEVGAL